MLKGQNQVHATLHKNAQTVHHEALATEQMESVIQGLRLGIMGSHLGTLKGNSKIKI